jgi:hypothetical protein
MGVDCFTCAYSDLQLVKRSSSMTKGCSKFADYEQPLAGKGLILGSDTNGETKGATSKLATIMGR